MAKTQITLMDPPIEELLDKVDSKFTLVALASRRARQVNSYYNSLGEGLGVVVPPQVASVSGKPLSIAFEEVAAGKATYTRPDPEEIALAEAAALALLEGEGEGVAEVEVEVDGVEAVAVVVEEVEPVAAASDETVD
jgi:DNA-directed RNA polymerase subunit omega